MMWADLAEAARVAVKLGLLGAGVVAVVPPGDILVRLPNGEYKRLRVGNTDEAWSLIETGFELGWAQCVRAEKAEAWG